MVNILVIDDELSLRKLIKANLVASGYSVTTAKSGEDGLKLAQRMKPDLILTDIKMPGISGWKVLNNLRSSPELSQVPVVIATACLSLKDEERTKELGIFHLSKPFCISELMAQVNQAL
jgi:CheY-like chemotaxis protein